MAKDWSAVAHAIRTRMEDLEMTQAEFIHKSRLAPMTIRNLLSDTPARKAGLATLSAASEALGWPRNCLEQVLNGTRPADPDAADPVLTELGAIRERLGTPVSHDKLTEEIAAINRRLDRIERQIANSSEGSG